ncbi:MAG: ThiF family adenylyltransferase [Pseudomonadota bacterium]|nr:ThiF family adenylyltransferase [Pseudomonadota bacterium]
MLDAKVIQDDVVQLHVRFPVGERKIALVIYFSDIHPYTRFEVFAGELDLPHHQNPIAKNLCLIGRSTRNWNVRDLCGDLIAEQLPRVLEAGNATDRDATAAIEQQQAEPFGNYYWYPQDAMLLVDGQWKIEPNVKSGELALQLDPSTFSRLRGAVLQVLDDLGTVLADGDPAIETCFPQKLKGSWVRLAAPVVALQGEEFFRALVAQNPGLAKRPLKQIGHWRIDVVGVLFPEETAWREIGDGWVFVVRVKDHRDGKTAKVQTYLARAGRAGQEDLLGRIPELRTLSDRTIAVAGIGGIGAPSALEFAKANVKRLNLMDFDIVDPGTAVRWPLGFSVSGLSKTEALREFIEKNYPYCNLKVWRNRIGVAPPERPGGDLRALDDFLTGVDLVYDSTAETGLQYLLSEMAAERGIPYICVSTNEGAWGGLVARIIPGSTGCWRCLQAQIKAQSIEIAPYDPQATVQPMGCGDPTFTGAGFDIMQIALAGVRLATSTLCADQTGAYPKSDWDVEVISFRDHNGKLIAPKWDVRCLRPIETCSCSRR